MREPFYDDDTADSFKLDISKLDVDLLEAQVKTPIDTFVYFNWFYVGFKQFQQVHTKTNRWINVQCID